MNHGGIVIGENYDPTSVPGYFSPRDPGTWGPGGKAPMLVDTLDVFSPHSLVVAGTRSGKTMSLIPTLAHYWRGGSVIFDPAVEIEPMVRNLREEDMGHESITLDLHHASSIGFNVCSGALKAIAAGSPMAETECLAIVEWVTGYTSKSDRTAEFFKDSGKSFFAALLLDTLYNPQCDPNLKNLRTVRMLQSQPIEGKQALLKRIAQDSASYKARQLATELIDGAADTLSGIFLNAHHSSEWLTTEAYADLVSGDYFDPADIVTGNTDVYICLPSKALAGTSAGIARCIVGALMDACYTADGTHPWVGFFLDEAKKLGRMEILEDARDDSAKYRVAIHQLLQSRWQLDQVWGDDGARIWLDNTGWQAYSGISDIKAAEEISRSIGTRGVQTQTTTKSRNLNFGISALGNTGRSSTISEVSAPLIQASEILQLRRDARLILSSGRPPAIVGTPLWYRRTEPWTTRVGTNRFFAA